ncbi:MAG: alanine--tRNA ligase [bacterium]
MNSNELRKLYLQFFAERGHSVRPSSSLIPEDASLLFTVAGMVPFKNYFLSKVPLLFTRATSSQKCIRTNDIDNVGRTRRHHTFFEMLGNFSFGDYFKEDTIKWGWEFLTEVVKIPKEKLYVTVYLDDNEAYDIWHNKMKIPADRIFRLGKETNFWEMGTVGPCGYCSEIYFDFEGGKKGIVTAEDIEKNDDRFLEVWNLVFTQFDKRADGTLGELKQKNIDTGMGLERLAAVSQGVFSNFETDLFMPIIKDVAEKAETLYGKDAKMDISLRVVADHARAVTFLIGDGVLPSNEGRGYVLRRLIRRAVRHGRTLGFKETFLYKVVPVVLHMMGEAYPETAHRKDYITQIIKLEEEKFQETMDKGLEILNAEIDTMKKNNINIMQGEIAFKLYDTYGFPIEITEEILKEHNINPDKEKFKLCMEAQRETAKKAWKGMSVDDQGVPDEIIKNIVSTSFTGYTSFNEENCKVIAIVKHGKKVSSATEGEDVSIFLDKSSFYGEGGGQLGDKGLMIGQELEIEVIDTQKTDNRYIHRAKITRGAIKEGSVVKTMVDMDKRFSIMKNHTGTHLLQAALRIILGSHVEQAGSYVGDDRLRFDFTHYEALTEQEVRAVEKMINQWIQESVPVQVAVMSVEAAKNTGAMALFEEKYKGEVRVVSVGNISKELCAGTHLHNIGEIGLFKILSSASTAAGIRRIEAITGNASYAMVLENENTIKELKAIFKTSDITEMKDKINKMIKEFKELDKRVNEVKKAGMMKNVEDYISAAKEINGVKVITIRFAEADKEAVRQLGDVLREKMKKAVIVIASTADDKISFLAMVTDDITDKYDASKIVKRAAAICGGGGGGKKNMAEAGGKDISKLDEALLEVEKAVKG